MSRHRDIRKLDYDEEYDQACDDAVYGHSVDDYDYGVSPGMEEYLYSRSRDNSNKFAAYFHTDEDIEEVEEANEYNKDEKGELERARHDSSSFERPKLSDGDEKKLSSALDEIRSIVGDQFTETEMVRMILRYNYDINAAVNGLLGASCPPSASTALPQRERRQRNKDSCILQLNSDYAVLPYHEFSPVLSFLDKQGKNLGKEAATGIRKLNLEKLGEQSSSNLSPSQVKQTNNVPVTVVATPNKGATPKVVRGFDIGQEDANSGQEGKLQPKIDPEERESRSSTPVRGDSAPSASKTPARLRDKEVDIEAKYKEERGDSKELINMVVVGHVDAGKSTLMGHLLYLQGNVAQRTMHKYEKESKKLGKQSFMYAWVLDDTDEERSRGVTVDIAQRVFETESKRVTLLDAPGHKDFIPNMITGAARADVAILVVDATTGAFEAGFDSGGQTREHAILIRSLGVSQIAVVINKLDTTEWSQSRFKDICSSLKNFLKSVGFREGDVMYIPCSGLTGENLVKKSSVEELNSWYKGPTLIEAIDKMKVPERNVTKPSRLCASDVYKGQGANMCVAGRLETGYVQNGDRLFLLPQGEVLTVKGVQVEGAGVGCAFAGDHVSLTVSGCDPGVLHIGDFLCDPTNPIPLVTRVQARVVIFSVAVPLIKGSQVDFHYQAVTEPAKIHKLVSQLHKTTGQVIKSKPRALVKNTSALIELKFSRPMCLELYRDVKELGRFMLRMGGSTIAAGLVTQILEAN
ncbi:translation elongation factor EF-1alpha (GTPase) HBS1 isoform X2 [Oratosquilla oratoria]|uniref:translation elongation factor EF-1alpha (GTPase) HBS1 isoform X2 n=1 Tax=Oratosquilla oratoria TaxID=337810 RepID=UPI003F75CAB9